MKISEQLADSISQVNKFHEEWERDHKDLCKKITDATKNRIEGLEKALQPYLDSETCKSIADDTWQAEIAPYILAYSSNAVFIRQHDNNRFTYPEFTVGNKSLFATPDQVVDSTVEDLGEISAYEKVIKEETFADQNTRFKDFLSKGKVERVQNNERSALLTFLIKSAHGNPNSATPSGQTALMIACRDGNPMAAITLVESGAQVNAETSTGKTALDCLNSSFWTDTPSKVDSERKEIITELLEVSSPKK